MAVLIALIVALVAVGAVALFVPTPWHRSEVFVVGRKRDVACFRQAETAALAHRPAETCR